MIGTGFRPFRRTFGPTPRFLCSTTLATVANNRNLRMPNEIPDAFRFKRKKKSNMLLENDNLKNNSVQVIMQFFQKELRLPTYERGFHLITQHIVNSLTEMQHINTGMLQVFIKHTSASLTINENADPTVRTDFESHINIMVPENASYYVHNYEGSDDMPAHIKASLMGASVQVPISAGRLNLGMWQGIYLCEHRNKASGRKLVLSAFGI